KRANGHRHPVDAEDFHLASAGDRRRRGRCECLHRTVVREGDRAMSALADAYRNRCLSADEITKSRRLTAFRSPQRGENPEPYAGAEGPKRESNGSPAGGTEAERRGSEQSADPEHRQESEKDRHRGGIVRPCRAQESQTQVRQADGHVKATIPAHHVLEPDG